MTKLRFAALLASFTAVGALSVAPASLAQDASPTIVVAQSTEPADDSIRVVYADLDRYEMQAAGLHSGQTGSAKRILKLLGQSEDRLNSSSNQDHASWKEANDRLQSLKADVQKWLQQ